jgi:hypothetical protein
MQQQTQMHTTKGKLNNIRVEVARLKSNDSKDDTPSVD